jgi:hypothetical protein
MPSRNRLITIRLVWQWLNDNFAAGLTLLAAAGGICFLAINTDFKVTVEEATALYSVNDPNKFQSTDMQLFAKVKDGRTINISLPQGWVPPASGEKIRVKRITKLFFGERFVLVR